MARFHTIGHSDRGFDEFVAMLKEAGVQVVADVRKLPGSRRVPAYDGDALSAGLAEHQIGYRHLPALGGRRSRQPDVPEEANAGWRNRSFHNYADYALSDAFAEGLGELVAIGEERPVAMMCAEAVWWRCHRRIVADYLMLAGHEVQHLMANGRADRATPTSGAQMTPEGRVLYPRVEGRT